MLMKPTVGRSVHFFNDSLDAGANNGIGAGPYAAVIVQVFSDTGDGDPYVNLTVFPPFQTPSFEGSVKLTGPRRWAWPERV